MVLVLCTSHSDVICLSHCPIWCLWVKSMYSKFWYGKYDRHVRSDCDVQKCHIDIKGLIRLCLILICCGLPLWKWKHNTIITYGQNLSIVLIQLQILITSNFFNNFKSRFLGIAANTLAPLIWAVASRLIYIFICMCSYIHQKCMN